MKFDPVHDAQSAFRSVLRAFAYPGTVQDATRETAAIDVDLGIEPAIALLALVLLDGETAFAWKGNGSARASETLGRLTYARAASAETADFIIAASGEASFLAAIAGARVGDLVDPQHGATVIGFVEGFEAGGAFAARGPGIDGERLISVDMGRRAGAAWMEARAVRNEEFPLGIDILFVEPRGRVMALPRTTSLRKA